VSRRFLAFPIAFPRQRGDLIEMRFASRQEAGRRLGLFLHDHEIRADVVLGLPRGGVVVAAEVARALQVPLDVLIVRKIGHPLHREFAVGALAEPDVVVLDDRILTRSPLIRLELDEVVDEEKRRLKSYQGKFHRAGLPPLEGKDVLLVDDGLATGATTEAAVLSVRKQGAHRIIVAAPVASLSAAERLRRIADDVQVLYVDAEFEAVGAYYDEFSQTTDEEVLQLLQAA